MILSNAIPAPAALDSIKNLIIKSTRLLLNMMFIEQDLNDTSNNNNNNKIIVVVLLHRML
jgi:hypothetical protein